MFTTIVRGKNGMTRDCFLSSSQTNEQVLFKILNGKVIVDSSQLIPAPPRQSGVHSSHWSSVAPHTDRRPLQPPLRPGMACLTAQRQQALQTFLCQECHEEDLKTNFFCYMFTRLPENDRTINLLIVAIDQSEEVRHDELRATPASWSMYHQTFQHF